jgi:DNA-directed RNA polymerase specialized sigma24 family protein
MIRQLEDQQSFVKIVDKLVLLAWHRYRVPRIEAEDIAQTAVTTYLEVHERYAGEANQNAILIGIFRNKCLEHIDRSVREREKLEVYGRRLEEQRRRQRVSQGCGGGSAQRPQQPALDHLIRKEDVELILSSLGELCPDARAMLSHFVLRDGGGRKGLLAKCGLNENTLDSQIRTHRCELRRLLRRKGVIE